MDFKVRKWESFCSIIYTSWRNCLIFSQKLGIYQHVPTVLRRIVVTLHFQHIDIILIAKWNWKFWCVVTFNNSRNKWWQVWLEGASEGKGDVVPEARGEGWMNDSIIWGRWVQWWQDHVEACNHKSHRAALCADTFATEKEKIVVL